MNQRIDQGSRNVGIAAEIVVLVEQPLRATTVASRSRPGRTQPCQDTGGIAPAAAAQRTQGHRRSRRQNGHPARDANAAMPSARLRHGWPADSSFGARWRVPAGRRAGWRVLGPPRRARESRGHDGAILGPQFELACAARSRHARPLCRRDSRSPAIWSRRAASSDSAVSSLDPRPSARRLARAPSTCAARQLTTRREKTRGSQRRHPSRRREAIGLRSADPLQHQHAQAGHAGTNDGYMPSRPLLPRPESPSRTLMS